MKEIYAVQNDDGTWHVVIKSINITQNTLNGIPIEEHCFATTDIPRADIKIIAYKDIDADETIFTLQI